MKKTISILLVVLTICMAVVSWFMLPDVVAMQIDMDGKVSNTMPKPFAILIPIAFSLIGFYINKKDPDNQRGMVFSFAGIAILIVTIVFNNMMS